MPEGDGIDEESLQLRFLAAAVSTTLVSFALAAALLTRFFLWSPAAPVTGPERVVAAADGTLYMLAGNTLLVHDRAGSSIAQYRSQELGLQAVGALFAIRDNKPILGAYAAGEDAFIWRPWHCSLAAVANTPPCHALTREPLTVESLAPSGLTDTLFAINDTHELLRIASGAVNQRIQLPANNTSMRVINHRGLLLINNSEGPGIGIYRPDAAAFGQQLDEILLLHPDAIARGRNQVLDFALAANSHWALLSDGAEAGLYRFDENWAPAATVALPSLPVSTRITTWRDRLLVYAPERLQVARVSADGRLEAPLLSESLASLAKTTHAVASRNQFGFSVVLLVLVALTVCGGLLTWMNFHRRDPGQYPHAAPGFVLERRLQQLRWLLPDSKRTNARQKWAVACIAVALTFCLSVAARMTALTFLCLPVLLLTLAARHYLARPAPQIGIDEDHLALVDHRGVYQTGPVGSFHACGPFIFRGGVIACTHLPGIPGLEIPASGKHTNRVKHRLAGAVPGHPATVVELLLQSRHPVLLPVMAIPVGLIIVTVWLTLPPAV